MKLKFVKINYEILSSKELNAGDKLVYSLISTELSFRERNTTCLANSIIAKHTGMSIATVKRSVTKLLDKNFIARTGISKIGSHYKLYVAQNDPAQNDPNQIVGYQNEPPEVSNCTPTGIKMNHIDYVAQNDPQYRQIKKDFKKEEKPFSADANLNTVPTERKSKQEYKQNNYKSMKFDI